MASLFTVPASVVSYWIRRQARIGGIWWYLTSAGLSSLTFHNSKLSPPACKSSPVNILIITLYRVLFLFDSCIKKIKIHQCRITELSVGKNSVQGYKKNSDKTALTKCTCMSNSQALSYTIMYSPNKVAYTATNITPTENGWWIRSECYLDRLKRVFLFIFFPTSELSNLHASGDNTTTTS